MHGITTPKMKGNMVPLFRCLEWTFLELGDGSKSYSWYQEPTMLAYIMPA